MRRWLAGLLVLALAGCADLPAGVDGDLTDGWPAVPVAEQFRPALACHADVVERESADDYAPVGCDEPHLAETAVIADLPGSETVATGRGRAFRECSKRVGDFLGADWRTGWLVLQPVLPSAAAWTGGARWYRCDLVQTSPVSGELVRRTGSLRGSLKGAGPVRMTCANPTVVKERVTALVAVNCAREHTAEFAGVFSSRGTSAGELEKGCHTVIAKFAGLADDGTVRNRVGWLGFPPDAASWKLGDRAVRCFLWLNGERMTGTYRDAGPRKLKIHYVSR
ncbi:septum formation family protein [Actinoplanes bogorensis]|uniref:Septum formation family protein n=1 Tax=Paractinoplanes bogorensis TaxID=1610840 RepID=A0ABS5YTH5_9ACTN|nr:septum formation family protein [Actinoplanes bogorensis]MBU2666752.1 septum formation family protein [Actinoplanes bogorensis]